jgi:hypothetical protein
MVADGCERSWDEFAAWPNPLRSRQNDLAWRAWRNLPQRIALKKYHVSWIIDLVAIFVTRSELIPEHLIKLVHTLHTCVDAIGCIKSGHRQVATWSVSIHPAMLNCSVLLRDPRISAVEKANHICDRYTTIERLSPDVDIEWTSLPELT